MMEFIRRLRDRFKRWRAARQVKRTRDRMKPRDLYAQHKR